MLTSLVLTLTTDPPLTFPPHLGRACHAAFLRLVSQTDPDLAERLHAPDERRPFTCSNLWGVRRKGRSLTLAPGSSAFLRYTGLTAEVSHHLQQLAEDSPSHIELEGTQLTVQQATLDPAVHSWAGYTTYEEMGAIHLLPGDLPSNRAELEFAAPTGFRSGGHTLPLPLPPAPPAPADFRGQPAPPALPTGEPPAEPMARRLLADEPRRGRYL